MIVSGVNYFSPKKRSDVSFKMRFDDKFKAALKSVSASAIKEDATAWFEIVEKRLPRLRDLDDRIEVKGLFSELKRYNANNINPRPRHIESGYNPKDSDSCLFINVGGENVKISGETPLGIIRNAISYFEHLEPIKKLLDEAASKGIDAL
ncbi:MAG: hypothetical protein PHC64_00410 [Candidatus Gastranaerophilales bacterium]|nr:hypothetical protein [Candidatus Gastranaerophilales bacterium]